MRKVGSPNIHGEKDAHHIWRGQLWQYEDDPTRFGLIDEREAAPGFLNGIFPLLTAEQRQFYERFDGFRLALEAAYRELFTTEEYSYAAKRTTPAILAGKMTEGLRTGSAHHSGTGIQRACKAVGIKYTKKAIREYLNPTPAHV